MGGLRGAVLLFRHHISLDWRELDKIFGLGGIGFFVLLVGWGIVELRDPWPGSLLYRLVFLESRYFTVSADLTVDGEQVRLDRVIECYPASLRSGFDLGWDGGLTVEAVGQRLSSGGGVFVFTPDVCAYISGEVTQSGDVAYHVPPLSEGYLPLIAWTDDYDDPVSIEFYVSRSYYGRGSSRVTINSVSVADAPQAPTADPPNDFLTFANRYYTRIGHPTTVRYIGFYVVEIPETAWRADTELASYLVGLAEPHVLPVPYKDWASDAVRPLGVWSEMLAGLGVPPGPAPGPGPAASSSAEEFQSFDAAVPLRRRDGLFHVSEGERGLVVLYRIDVDDEIGHRFSLVPVDFEGGLFGTFDFGYAATYEPDRRRVYLYQDLTAMFVPR